MNMNFHYEFLQLLCSTPLLQFKVCYGGVNLGCLFSAFLNCFFFLFLKGIGYLQVLFFLLLNLEV